MACGAIARTWADPWIPAAGSGKIKSVLRVYRSDRVFSTTHFGRATDPSTSTLASTQLKVTGNYGLGHRWALQYDLSAAQNRKTKTKKGVTTDSSSAGLKDEVIGIARGLRQGDRFADAVAFNIVLPTGSASSTPRLGVGHTAIEPDYMFGVKHNFGPRQASLSLMLGPRFFFNGHVTQWRMTGEAATALRPHVDIFGTVFYARTFGSSNNISDSQNPDAAEEYNLLRAGVGLRFSLAKNIKPLIEYETDLAGKNIHAGHRWVLGMSWRY